MEPITLDQAAIASKRLRALVEDAPTDLKKRHVRALVSEIVVGKSQVLITGPKDALAEAVSGDAPGFLAAGSGPVRSLVREWRTNEGEKQNWSARRRRLRIAS